jgi:hypothetical protein
MFLLFTENTIQTQVQSNMQFSGTERKATEKRKGISRVTAMCS